ncbi:MAG: serine/threonine protein kinase [Proteobacteria bacterium]|nr:MAG: serine/threonine protein kinase [Pseudomonadota bacterium]QKK12283.1 MAG: protein kinase [Pseudomonadota bacterium]
MGILDGFRINKAVATIVKAKSAATSDVADAVLQLKQSGEGATEKLIEALGRTRTPGTVVAVLGTFLDNSTLHYFANALTSKDATIVDGVAKVLAAGKRYDPNLLLEIYADPASPKGLLSRILLAQRERLNIRSLLRLMGKIPPEARTGVFRIMEEVASAENVNDLIGFVESDDPVIRLHTARVLRRFSTEAVRDALMKLLSDSAKAVRLEALTGLSELSIPVDIEPLCKMLRDADMTVQSKAIDTIIRINSPDSVQYLLEVLQDDSEYVRRAAVEVLNEVGNTNAIKDLITALRDQDWWVRVRAADALGSIGGPRVVESVLSLIKDEDEFIRRFAIEILNSTKDSRAKNYLEEALKDDDWWVRERAVDALAAIGDVSVLPKLVELMKRDSRAAPVVIKALTTLGDSQAVKPIMEMLHSADTGIRKEALRALAVLADENNVDEVRRAAQELCNSSNDDIRALADTTVNTLIAKPNAAQRAKDISREPVRTGSTMLQAHSMLGGEVSSSTSDATIIAETKMTSEGHAAVDAIDAAKLKPGEVIADRYRIIRHIGRGAFGVVVLVQDMMVHEDIVLKFITPQLTSSEDVIKRFVLEMKYARKITHENVIRIYDFITFGSSYAMSMEYFESHSLAAELKSGKPMSLQRALRILLDICSGMIVTHKGNLVHRDLKPSNILIDENDLVKIVDFGLAAAAREGESRLTKTGIILGTPTYMAPEQVKGGKVDSRTDVYSLGIIMYEMFTGRPPYVADDPMGILFQHMEGKAKPPREQNTSLPEDLDALIRKAMARKAEDRFANMDELRQAVAQLLEKLGDDRE